MRIRLSAAFVVASLTVTAGARADSYFFEMDFTNGSGPSADFYATGFPSAQMLHPNGTGLVIPYVPSIPAGGDANCQYLIGGSVPFYSRAADMAAGLPGTDSSLGFGTTGTILFEFQHTGFGCGGDGCGQESLDESSLPTSTRDGHEVPMRDPHPSVVPQIAANANRSSVFLISVDAASGDFLRLYPVTTDFGQSNFCPAVCGVDLQNFTCGGKKNKLAISPLQGVPLRPNTLYAAVVTDGVTHDGGTPIDMAPGLSALLGCMSDAKCDASHGATATDYASGISSYAYDEYAQAIRVLQSASGPTYDSATVFKTIRALTVFKTGDPTAGFKLLVDDALTNPAVDADVKTPWSAASSRFPLVDPKGKPITDHGQQDGNPGTPIVRPGVFGEFCVFEATVSMPNYQQGPKPYSSYPDGQVRFDLLGTGFNPRLLGNDATGRIFVTIPRKPMPPTGYPVVVLERAGAGGDVPLVSRGPQYDNFPVYGWSGGPLHENVDPSCTWGVDDLCETQPGAGPAKWFSLAGYAGVQMDDPLGGNRRPSDQKISDEDGLIFNVNNPVAIRDNIRQAALELAVLGAKTLTSPTMSIPASVVDGAGCTVTSCTYGSDYLTTTCTETSPTVSVLAASGAPAVTFDVSSLALMGHSVGATIAPLALSAAPPPTSSTPNGGPIYKNAILSGAGASFLNNVLYKEEPALPVPLTFSRNGLREVAESWAFLNRQIFSEGDPAAGVIQWALEPWDAQVYHAQRITSFARVQHVLQFQGIIDHYIESPISDAAALSAGLVVGSTMRMQNNPSWIHGYDDDPGFYNHSGTTWEWEDDPSYHVDGTASGYDGEEFPSITHDWRAFEPYSSVVDLGAFATGFNGSSPVAFLPQTGKSVLVQVDNAGYAPGSAAQWSSFPGVTYEDGHEVMWQHIDPKLQYECFLQSALLGMSAHLPPIVPDELSDAHPTSCCPHVVAPQLGGMTIALPGMDQNCSPCVNAVCSKNPMCCNTSKPNAWIPDCATLAMNTPQCGPND